MSAPETPQVRDDEYFKQFAGKDIGTEKYRIKGKKLSDYAAAIGDFNPKYYKPKTEGEEKTDYSAISAHPAFASTYTIPGLLMSLPELVDNEGKKLVRNIGKLLHTMQEYNYEGCVPLTEADKKVVTHMKVIRNWLKGETMWTEMEFITTNEEGTKTFCKTRLQGMLRKGGF